MGIIELLLIAIGLSMDAFAVAVCKGLSAGKPQKSNYFTVGIWFGGFQALMPTIGFLLGSAFDKYIKRFDHWVAFVLLAFIGANMLKEGFSGETATASASFGFKTMSVMAIATSIDALAVGIAFAMVPPKIPIYAAVLLIGCITFILSAIGLKVGSIFGERYKSRAEIAGGIILIIIGLKILLEHLGVISL